MGVATQKPSLHSCKAKILNLVLSFVVVILVIVSAACCSERENCKVICKRQPRNKGRQKRDSNLKAKSPGPPDTSKDQKSVPFVSDATAGGTPQADQIGTAEGSSERTPLKKKQPSSPSTEKGLQMSSVQTPSTSDGQTTGQRSASVTTVASSIYISSDSPSTSMFSDLSRY